MRGRFGQAIREETYQVHEARFKDEQLPQLPWLDGYTVLEAYLLKTGRRLVDGVEREYQDIRVYLRETEQEAE